MDNAELHRDIGKLLAKVEALERDRANDERQTDQILARLSAIDQKLSKVDDLSKDVAALRAPIAAAISARTRRLLFWAGFSAALSPFGIAATVFWRELASAFAAVVANFTIKH